MHGLGEGALRACKRVRVCAHVCVLACCSTHTHAHLLHNCYGFYLYIKVQSTSQRTWLVWQGASYDFKHCSVPLYTAVLTLHNAQLHSLHEKCMHPQRPPLHTAVSTPKKNGYPAYLLACTQTCTHLQQLPPRRVLVCADCAGHSFWGDAVTSIR